MIPSGRGGGPWVLAAALLLTAPVAAAAQVPPDTLSPAEQLRARQRALLQRLGRPPGQDTLDFVGPDSLTADSPAPGPRAGPPGADLLDPAGDTVLARLLSDLAGYQPVAYEAATAEFDARTRDLYLYADSTRKVSVVSVEGQTTADSVIHYSDELVDALGRPVFTPATGEPVTSERLMVDTRIREASAFGASTVYREAADWHMTGDLNRIRPDLVWATHGRFTSCDLTVPHYHFGAERVKIIRGNTLVATDVVLSFGGVPVFWIPFVAQSLSTGRASGILTPRFGVNDVVRSSEGYQRRISNVGFYWAMSDYTDATLALDWFSDNFTSLTANLRYRWLRQFLSGNVTARRYWGSSGRDQLSLNARHAWQISERMSMSASVLYVTSTDFVRRNSFDPVEATQKITSSGGLNRRFDWGDMSLGGRRSQSLASDQVETTFPELSASIRTITFFPEAPEQASWYNNLTWGGSGKASLSTFDRPDLAEGDVFTFARADRRESDAQFSHGFGLGNFGVGQSVSWDEVRHQGVPTDSLSYFPGAGGDETPGTVDIGQESITWSSSLNYTQSLVGTSSITPTVTLSGEALRSDTIALAQSLVAGPTRLTLGANLRTYLYGFFPGVGPYEAIRHKISPQIRYQYWPAVEPTDLQLAVFGPQALRARNLISVGFSVLGVLLPSMGACRKMPAETLRQRE